MDYLVQRDGLLKSLIIVILIAVIGGFLLYWGLTNYWNFGFEDQILNQLINIVGGFMIFGALFYPILLTDLSDEIPEIKKLKKENSDRKTLKISHPRKGVIIFFTLLGFVTFGFFWLIALWIASGDQTVRIPDNIAIEAGLKKSS